MMNILIVVVVLSLLVRTFDAAFAAPTKGVTYFCYSLQCVADNTAALKPYDPVVIGVMTYSIAEDSYLALYLGSLLELFDMPEHFFVAMVLQNPDGMDGTEAAFQFIQYLPIKSIFVSIEHGRSGTGVETLRFLQQHGVAPRVIYHLNHEQPWATSQEDFLNYIFDSPEKLAQYYQGFDLVLRNYYYEPLLSSSYYLPVSAPFEGFVVGNASNSLFTAAQQRLASHRSQLCHFKGRVDYAKYSRETPGSNKPPVMIQSDEFFPQAVERREILRLAAEGQLGGCQASASDESTANSYRADSDARFMASYDEYTRTLADTVFVLCPAGNHPETFRHIEVLEFGAIPVMLRPSDPAKDFLRDAHWAGYPGPVLGSWTELAAFLKGMTPSLQDALQQRVQEWYAQFKHSKKRRLLAELQRVFSQMEDTAAMNGIGAMETVRVDAQRTEQVRVLRDLQFRDIPAGPYASAMQRLLAQVLKLESKVRLLEQLLVAATSEDGNGGQ